MPTRRTGSKTVLWEVIAPVARWPMRSPRRLLATTLVLVVGLVLSARLGDSQGSPAAAPAGSSAPITTGTSTASPAADPTDPSEAATGTAPAPSSGSTSSPSSEDVELSEEDGWVDASSATPSSDPAEADLVNRLTSRATRIVTDLAARPAKADAAAQKTWYRKVAQHMTLQAAEDYEGIDPRRIPFTKVTGTATVAAADPDQADLVRFVSVPTDAGTVVVHMGRQGPAWAVSRLVFPPEKPAPPAAKKPAASRKAG